MSKPTSILICDDESHILHVLGIKLCDAGFEVLTASDGDEGWRLVKQHAPQCVITDVLMPGIDGLDLCRKTRENPPTQESVLVLLTGRGSSLNDEQLEPLNLSAIFSKPFSPREVLTHIKAQLTPHQAKASEANG